MTRRTTRHRGRIGTGVLAVALMAPAADATLADATEPAPEQENEYEGGNESESQDGAGEGAGDLSPGQDSTGPLQDDNSPPLVAPGDPANPEDGESEDGPLETEVDGEPVATPVPEPTPAPPPSAPTPPAAPTPAPAPQAPSQLEQPVPAPKAGVAPIRRQAKPGADRDTGKARKRTVKPRSRPAPARTRGGNDPTPRRPVERAPIQAPPATAPVASAAGTGPTYAVRSGDTLWAIASARLGGGASPAQIAREVQRIWDLNARAIGTGDPSLIAVGTELRLR